MTTSADLQRVREALHNNGYAPEGILTAEYKGRVKTDTNKEIYAITFYNYDDELDSGFVYVWEEDGELIGDF